MMISHNMEQTIGKTNQKVVGRGYERNPQNGMVHTHVHLRINMFDTKEDAAAHAQTYVEVAWEEFCRKFGCAPGAVKDKIEVTMVAYQKHILISIKR